jgi:hypothetical protein
MTVDRDKVLQRRKEEWECRMQGMSYDDIGKRFNITSSTVFADLEVARKELKQDTIEYSEQEKIKELSRLNQILSKLFTALSNTDIPKELSQLTLAYKGINERISKIMGLDAPVKTSLTGGDGGPLHLIAGAADWQSKMIDMGWSPPQLQEREILPGLPAPLSDIESPKEIVNTNETRSQPINKAEYDLSKPRKPTAANHAEAINKAEYDLSKPRKPTAPNPASISPPQNQNPIIITIDE